jgi:hypothetical protein
VGAGHLAGNFSNIRFWAPIIRVRRVSVAVAHRFVTAPPIRVCAAAALPKSLSKWQLHVEIRLRECETTNIRVGNFFCGAKNRNSGMHFIASS